MGSKSRPVSTGTTTARSSRPAASSLDLFDALGVAAALLDGEGTITAVNRCWSGAADPTGSGAPACGGGTGEDYVATCARAFASSSVDGVEASVEAVEAAVGLRALLTGATARFRLDYAVACAHKDAPADGPGERWYAMTATPVDAERSGYLVVHADITERKATEIEFARTAMRDPLTGLPNRTALIDHLAEAIERAKRTSTSPAVLLADLDRFKEINDSLGHDVGDEVLQACVPRLCQSVRPDDFVARFGEDEFVIVLDRIPDTRRAVSVAERLRAAFDEPIAVHGQELYVNVSIGVAVFDEHDPDQMLRRADSAMYEAKARGRARCELFDDAMRAAWSERMGLEQELRRAVDAREFAVYYQPIADAVTGRLYGAEALLRWQHPERGTVSPWPIIPIAEETGLILQIGALVMNEATRVAASFADYGTPLTISINLSARQLSDPRLLETVEAALAAASVDPAHICFEITESAVMNEPQLALRVLHQLRELGLRLALDDFGTGYSSLAYLRDFPVDVLKIDQSFVRRLRQDPRDDAVVSTVIGLARGLSLKTVAEGVETIEQLTALQEVGCDRIQGYLVGQAQPARALRGLALQSAEAPLIPLQSGAPESAVTVDQAGEQGSHIDLVAAERASGSVPASTG